MDYKHIYLWEDPLTTLPIFTTVLVLLIFICYYSLISLIGCSGLMILLATSVIKIYSFFMTRVLKKNFSDPLDYIMDPRIPDKRMKELISDMLITVNLLILDMRHVFLVEDILDTIKFGLFLWLLAYMGSLINAITIIIIVWTGLFTIPKVKSR